MQQYGSSYRNSERLTYTVHFLCGFTNPLSRKCIGLKCYRRIILFVVQRANHPKHSSNARWGIYGSGNQCQRLCGNFESRNAYGKSTTGSKHHGSRSYHLLSRGKRGINLYRSHQLFVEYQRDHAKHYSHYLGALPSHCGG